MTVENYNLDFKLDTPYLISENLFGSNINHSDIITLNLNNVSIKFHEDDIMLILQKSEISSELIYIFLSHIKIILIIVMNELIK